LASSNNTSTRARKRLCLPRQSKRSTRRRGRKVVPPLKITLLKRELLYLSALDDADLDTHAFMDQLENEWSNLAEVTPEVSKKIGGGG